MEIQVSMDMQQDYNEYKQQTATNEALLLDIMKSIRPDVYQLLLELNQTTQYN